MIIPFFIPHAGCPHQCVFCDQKKITGQTNRHASSLPAIIDLHLSTGKQSDVHRVAFYGGTFTALPLDLQKAYLEAVKPFIGLGRIESIRLSTRPDAVNAKILDFLKGYGVRTIELGVQSMDDSVLCLAGRGHSASHTVAAMELLTEHEFETGIQLMPGLPGDSPETFRETVERTISLQPDFIRIYPALVIANTPLDRMYRQGLYAPLTFDQAICISKNALLRFEQAGIEVIRIGLQPSEELEKDGTIIAGPYHPAFRQLVESSIMLDRMKAALPKQNAGDAVEILVNPLDLSSAIGQKRCNIEMLRLDFGVKVLIRPDEAVPRRKVKLSS